MTEENNPPANTGQGLNVPVAIVIAGLIIAGAIFYSNNKTSSLTANVATNEQEETTSSFKIRPVDETDHIRGNPDAEVTIVEYSDLECPYCKDFHKTMNKVMDAYGKDGKVAWVYRHFPLTTIHPKAVGEAIASECAAELGGNQAFWSYIDKIFEVTPSNNRLDESLLPQIAEEIGLNKELFNECVLKGEKESIIERDFNDGVENGVRGTPYSFIVSKTGKIVPLNGALPYSNLKSTIDNLLK